MSFRPIKDDHAVVEVAFVIMFKLPISGNDVELLAKNREKWKERLPGMAKKQRVGIAISGNEMPVPSTPLGTPVLSGVEFSRSNPDGSLEWRLRAEDNYLAVNCLVYTRWADIWKKARELLFQATSILLHDGQLVTGFALDYVDKFVWEGKADKLDAKLLFNSESSLLPANIFDSGQLWHSHSGWFVSDGLPAAGKRLDRVNIDARLGEKTYESQIQIVLTHNLDEGVKSPAAIFGRKNQRKPALIDLCINGMHDENKKMMKKLLKPEMAERISL